jgi:hypothetical protein
MLPNSSDFSNANVEFGNFGLFPRGDRGCSSIGFDYLFFYFVFCWLACLIKKLPGPAATINDSNLFGLSAFIVVYWLV